MFRICLGQNQLPVALALPIQNKHHFVAKSSYRFKAIIRKKNCKGSDLARWQIMSGQSGDRSFISDYFLTFYCDISLCSFTLKLLHVLSHVCYLFHALQMLFLCVSCAHLHALFLTSVLLKWLPSCVLACPMLLWWPGEVVRWFINKMSSSRVSWLSAVSALPSWTVWHEIFHRACLRFEGWFLMSCDCVTVLWSRRNACYTAYCVK